MFSATETADLRTKPLARYRFEISGGICVIASIGTDPHGRPEATFHSNEYSRQGLVQYPEGVQADGHSCSYHVLPYSFGTPT